MTPVTHQLKAGSSCCPDTFTASGVHWLFTLCFWAWFMLLVSLKTKTQSNVEGVGLKTSIRMWLLNSYNRAQRMWRGLNVQTAHLPQVFYHNLPIRGQNDLMSLWVCRALTAWLVIETSLHCLQKCSQTKHILFVLHSVYLSNNNEILD